MFEKWFSNVAKKAMEPVKAELNKTVCKKRKDYFAVISAIAIVTVAVIKPRTSKAPSLSSRTEKDLVSSISIVVNHYHYYNDNPHK